jgi:hypothetical protein
VPQSDSQDPRARVFFLYANAREYVRIAPKSAMDTTILLAILAATVTAIGWMINYVLNGRDERRKEQLDASHNYLQSQLQELYGPLAFLIQESRRSRQDLLMTLGRDQIFVPGQELTDAELKAWLFWVENDIFPRNDKIHELLTGKTHLIEGDHVPASYLEFLDHHTSWKLSHMRWKQENVQYPWHSRVNYPEDFHQDVLDTFEKLKEKQARILGERHVKDESLLPLTPQPPSADKK